MDPKKLFYDDRFNGICVYCGAYPDTRDHVPSKVLLDEPYPIGLPVVACCKECNNSFSYDEVYIACFIECVINGTSEPNSLNRQKIKRILTKKNHLREKIESCKSTVGETLLWTPEPKRVRNVILKLARGHAAYELAEPQMGDPQHISIWPYGTVSDDVMTDFERSPTHTLWPEIGSRAFMNASINNFSTTIDRGWNITQNNTYRYMVSYEGAIEVKMVLSEYLFCKVTF